MKTIIKLSFCFALSLTGTAYAVVVTDVKTDGTMGGVGGSIPVISGIPTVTQNLGKLSSDGHNLFHSFATFNIGAGDTVSFTGNPGNSIGNIISRVTGIGNPGGLTPSNIYGTLSVDKTTLPNANFYFINPAGVTFGANAVVDVPAAFHVSTANQISFPGGVFSATNPGSDVSTLTADPVNFGFLGTNTTGTITFDGSNITLDKSPHQTLDLVANNITVENKAYANTSTYVIVPTGEIRMVAVQGATEVSLQRTADDVLPLPTVSPSANNAGNITIDSSNIGNYDNSNDGAGRVAVWGGNISLTNNQHNAHSDGFWSTRICADNSGALNPAATSGVTVYANTLYIDGGSVIQANSNSTGNAANINVNAKSLTITAFQKDPDTEAKGIASNAENSGRGGTITVNADYLKIDGTGVPSGTEKEDGVGILSVNEDGAIGTAGNIIVNAGKIDVVNGGQISASSETDVTLRADAGNVTVSAGSLNILKGGQISSSTFNQGNAGVVTINAGQLKIDGQGSTEKTGVLTDTNLINADGVPYDPLTDPATGKRGNAGTITVNGGVVNIANDGEISSSTFSSGKAGGVNVSAATLNIDNAFISAAAIGSTSSGQTGNINVTTTQALNLTNNAKITLQNDATIANPAAIIPTTLTVTSPNITLTNSKITTEATGNIKASDIVINFSDKLMMDPSFILTTANTGDGGSIYINGGNLIYLTDSGFLTSVSGANSSGGNIYVNAGFLIMNTGVIQANAIGGFGGDVTLNLKGLIPSYDNLILAGSWVNWQPFVPGFNVIQAASAKGVSGNINISSPKFNISGITKGLDAGSLVLPAINRNPCQNVAGNSFKRSGIGGLPINEEKDDFISPAAPLTQSNTSSKNITSELSQSTSSQPCAATSI